MYKQELDRFPVRKNPRMKSIDYSAVNYYFITICTWNKMCIFGKAGQPNELGKIAEQGLQNISDHFSGVRMDKYIVMPNHVHGIIAVERQGVNLAAVIGQYKSFVSREIHRIYPQLRVWQTSFHDHVIRNQKEYQQIWRYIDANVSNWGNDCFYISAEEK